MGIFSWLKKLITYDPSVYKPPIDSKGDSGSGMNEGDFRSGPEGYSPNTAYPDSFYNSGGSGQDGQDEGDSSR